MSGPGDLARRIVARRHALGLSRAEVAERAGMDPGYLARLESAPAPAVSAWGVFRLASALETTVDALRGGPSHGGVGPGTLEPLDVEECWSRIADGGVGRIVLGAPDGPVAFPVTFTVVGRSLRFRTAADGTIADGLSAGRASLEVDRVDEAVGEGWSVIVTGVVEVRAATPSGSADGPAPQLEGHDAVEVELRPDVVTGRRIRRLHDAS